MHQTPIAIDFRSALANPPFVADNTDLYRIVADAIARQPDHLGEMVSLMVALQVAGVDLAEHWDCLVEAIVLEVEDGDAI